MEEVPKQENKPDISATVRTLETDLKNAASGESGKVVHDLIEKEREERQLKKSKSLSSFKNQIFLLFGVILIAASIAAIGFVFFSRPKQEKIAVVPVFLFTEKTDTVRTDAATSVRFAEQFREQILNTPQNPNTVHTIEVRDSEGNLIDTPELLTLFQNIPAQVQSEIAAIQIGTTTIEGETRVPYILLYMSSENPLATLSYWEETMVENLYDFFGIKPANYTGDIFNTPFETHLVTNKEIRSVTDTDKTVIMYAAIRPSIFIITRDQSVYTEILRRTDQSR